MSKISVVINTRNEEENLPRVLQSVKNFADEIVVVDMFSTDKTVAIARKAGAKVYTHRTTGYVEPARNFAIGKATGDWILILDADEELSPALAKSLRKITKEDGASYYRLPRKNIIFGKWIRYSRWWPDHNIRFFKKGSVRWSEIIHSVPETHGKGRDLPATEENAIVHHAYQSVTQYLDRLNNYTSVQAKFLVKDGYKFSWADLFRKPTSEFLGRFFVGEAYKDGVHGLALSLFQAFSELVIYLKVWEQEKFQTQMLSSDDINNEMIRIEAEFDHWLVQKGFRPRNLFQKLLKKLFR